MTSRTYIAALRRHPATRATRPARLSIAAGLLAGAAFLAFPITAEAAGKPAKPTQPAAGAEQILPMNLGPASECPRTSGLALNDGYTTGLYVVGQGLGCSNPAFVGAVR